MDQANLLMVAMAERCLRIIQDKPEDVRFGLPAPAATRSSPLDVQADR